MKTVRWLGVITIPTVVLVGLLVNAAPGDIVSKVVTPSVALTTPQKTTLGNFIAAKWPGVALADVRQFGCTATECRTCYVETLTQSSLFALLGQGVTVNKAETGGQQLKCVAPVTLSGAEQTQLASFFVGVYPLATGSVELFDCSVRPNGAARDADCTGMFATTLSEASSWTLWQAGYTIKPLGVVQ